MAFTSGQAVFATGADTTESKTAANARTALGLGSLATVTPTGTPDGTKFLRDDNSWQAASGGSDPNIATDSVAVGTSSLAAATPTNSTAVGNSAGERVTTSNYDVFMGRRAGRGAVSGTSQDNVAIGNQALQSISNAQENTALGSTAGLDVTTGDGNVMIGFQSGDNITTGSNNVFIGKNAGHDSDLATGSGNVMIGYGAGSFDISDVSNTLLIDSNETDLDALVYGEFDNRVLRINGEFYVKVAGADSFQIDDDATAGNTRMLVWDVDNGTLERVSVGAADSAGSGFKVLRIPN
jgi:hypothetical protein